MLSCALAASCARACYGYIFCCGFIIEHLGLLDDVATEGLPKSGGGTAPGVMNLEADFLVTTMGTSLDL